MTEESFQQARKLMQSANHARGLITSAKGDVAKWTKIESAHRENLSEAQANGAKKMLDKAMANLEKQRARFAAMKFPESDIVKQYVQARCASCNCPVAQGNTICGECACEDDSNY